MYPVTVDLLPRRGAAALPDLTGLRRALVEQAGRRGEGLEHVTVAGTRHGLSLTCFVRAQDPEAALTLVDRLCRAWTTTGPLRGWSLRSSPGGPR